MQPGQQSSARSDEAQAAVSVESYFQEIAQLISRLPYGAIEGIVATLRQASEEGRTIFVFGNGGSAATASHFVCDLAKGTIHGDRRLKVMALNDNVPLLTAWANDFGYEHVFSGQLKNFIQAGDVAVAISGSGRSRNIVEGLKAARAAGAITVGIAGFDGGEMPALCDVCAIVPSENYQLIEDMHHAIAHCVFSVLREQLRRTKNQTAAAGAGT